MATQINREFALLAACCRWPPSAEADATIVDAATGPLDWSRFLRVVARHRVAGLVWHALTRAHISLPADIAQSLKASAAMTARSSLQLCAETIRLQRAFAAAGQSCAFIKGASLARLAYGDVGIRHAKDIDMIVPEVGLAAACDLLGTMGYRRIRPHGSMKGQQMALWRRYGKDIGWRHGVSGIELELHWHLIDATGSKREPFDFGVTDQVPMTPSVALTTLTPAALFDYLCLHGASHGWMRLKWLSDINALLAQGAEEDLVAHLDRARRNGLVSSVGPAILLCHRLFNLPVPAAVAAELARSRLIRWLAAFGHFLMTRGQAEIEIYDLQFGTASMNLFHLLTAGSPRAALAAIWRQSISLHDIETFALPSSLVFLYPLVRWPLWAYRRMAHALGLEAK